MDNRTSSGPVDGTEAVPINQGPHRSSVRGAMANGKSSGSNDVFEAVPVTQRPYNVAVRNTFLEFSDPVELPGPYAEGEGGSRRRAWSVDRGLSAFRPCSTGAHDLGADHSVTSAGFLAVWPSFLNRGVVSLEAGSARSWPMGSRTIAGSEYAGQAGHSSSSASQHNSSHRSLLAQWSPLSRLEDRGGGNEGCNAFPRELAFMELSEQQSCLDGAGAAESVQDFDGDGRAEGQVELDQQGPITTLMIRNITCRYTQEQVVEVLDQLGLAETYDFLYLPLNPSRRANLGYMFVNFKTPEYAEECRQLLQGKPLGSSSSDKLCEVIAARVQGAENVARHSQKKRR